MNDIVQRIRSMRCIYPTDASELLADAAAEIERLSLALEQRYRTNHDAAPAARAAPESVGTDKAEPLQGLGTGDTPADTGTTQPRNGAVRGPDSDSRVWETHTPQPQATPGECSKLREGTSEPVAWWVRGCEYDTGCEYEFVALLKEQAELAATQGGKAVPLYQSPSLTDAEREAVEIAVEYVGSAFQVEHHAAVLRGLLERLG